MQSRLWRQRYSLAGLAILTAIVLAGCPAAQGISKPTVSEQLADISSLAVRETTNRSLNNAFNGKELVFSASTDAPSVAGASISANRVFVAAIGPGTAKITVTATNSGGTASQFFRVTVLSPDQQPPDQEPDPEPPDQEPDPEPEVDADYTIKLGESVKHTLASGQTLQAPSSGAVAVGRSQDGEAENVWLITAKKKGSHKVSVLEEGKSVGMITVEVPNSRPVRQDQTTGDSPVVLSNPKITLTAAKAADLDLTLGGDDAAADNPDISAYFVDDDSEDTIRYRIEDKPSWFLVEAENGFLKDADSADGFQLSYEVLQKVVPSNEKDYEFTVSLYASDGEEEATRPVVIEFNVGTSTLSPLAIATYAVDQDASGNFRDGNKDGAYNNKLEVGPRREVTHTLTFRGTAGTLSATGFVFVENALEDVPPDERTSTGTTTIYYRDARNVVRVLGGALAQLPTSYQDPGTRYILIRGSSGVVIEGGTADSITIAENAQVPFSLKSSGSGSIVIDYKIWLDKGVVTTVDDPNEGDTTATKTASKTLTISVVECSSPPDSVADCP